MKNFVAQSFSLSINAESKFSSIVIRKLTSSPSGMLLNSVFWLHKKFIIYQVAGDNTFCTFYELSFTINLRTISPFCYKALNCCPFNQLIIFGYFIWLLATWLNVWCPPLSLLWQATHAAKNTIYNCNVLADSSVGIEQSQEM